MLYFSYEIFLIIFLLTFIRLSIVRICLIKISLQEDYCQQSGTPTLSWNSRMSGFIGGFNLFVNCIANSGCTFVIFFCQDLIKKIFELFQGIFE